MDWFKGKSTGNHRFSHSIWGIPVNFPLNQSIEYFQLQGDWLACLTPVWPFRHRWDQSFWIVDRITWEWPRRQEVDSIKKDGKERRTHALADRLIILELSMIWLVIGDSMTYVFSIPWDENHSTPISGLQSTKQWCFLVSHHPVFLKSISMYLLYHSLIPHYFLSLKPLTPPRFDCQPKCFAVIHSIQFSGKITHIERCFVHCLSFLFDSSCISFHFSPSVSSFSPFFRHFSMDLANFTASWGMTLDLYGIYIGFI